MHQVGILRQIRPLFDGVFAKHKSKNLIAQIEGSFQAFIQKLRIQVLPLSFAENATATVVQDYFEQRPPFKEGRKRHEFPDAFAAAILKHWCDTQNENLFVVKNDPDWAGLCTDRLTYQKALAEFFALFPDPELARQLVEAINGPGYGKIGRELTVLERLTALGE